MSNMPERQAETYRVTDPEQIDAMASPARLEIIDAVRVLGPCSVAEVADLLGRTADSLYYHVRKLVEVGLLIPSGTRETARRDETLYRTPGRRMRLPHDPKDGELTELRLKAFAALLRLTERDHRAAFEKGLAKITGPRRNLVNARIKGWLNDEQLAEVHEHIDRILDIFHEGAGTGADEDERGNLHAVTVFLTPIEPKKRVR